ncbi:MAG: hypothetical protein IJU35_04055 [Paludibacteraceae bacterium]|nr:hypothetical protein [Paludibacteraceae bacterium]
MDITPNMVDALPVSASKIYNPKNYVYVITCALVVVGCACALIFGNLDNSGSVYYILAFAAALALAALCYYLFAGEKVYRSEDGKILQSKELYFANGSARTLYEALANANTAQLSKLAPIAEGGVRLDILYSPDRKYGVAQVYAYEPYQYVAYEQVVKLDTETLALLL